LPCVFLSSGNTVGRSGVEVLTGRLDLEDESDF
jgi:hypothetical protein